MKKYGSVFILVLLGVILIATQWWLTIGNPDRATATATPFCVPDPPACLCCTPKPIPTETRAGGPTAVATATVIVPEPFPPTNFSIEKWGVVCVGIYTDDNKNGVWDTDEEVLPGVVIGLFDEWGLPVGKAISEEANRYCFTEIKPGRYTVLFGDDVKRKATSSSTIRSVTVLPGKMEEVTVGYFEFEVKK